MSLFGLGSEILTEMRVDAGQAKAELRELKELQHALGEEQGKVVAEQNKGLQEWIEKLGKVSLAIVAIKEVGEVVWDGYLDGLKDARLATAALGIDIEKLKEASHGLVTENQLLEFAAKANKAAFKNTQEDMENAQKAILALTRDGRDQKETMEGITEAMNNLKVKGLTNLGIYVDTSKVKFDEAGEVVDNYGNKLELHKKIMEAIKVKGDEVSDGLDRQGEAMARFITGLKDGWDDLKKALGQLIVALEPFAEAIAFIVKKTKEALDLIPSLPKLPSFGLGGGFLRNADDAVRDVAQRMGHRSLGEEADLADERDERAAAAADWGRRLGEAFNVAVKNYYINPNDIEFSKDDLNRKGGGYSKVSQLVNIGGFDASALRAKNAGYFGSAAQEDIGIGGALSIKTEEIDLKRQREMVDVMSKVIAQANEKRQSLLQSIFGKPDEYELYKNLWSSLSGVVTNVYTAIVTGQESVGSAAKKAVAQAALAMGAKLAVDAVSEEVQAWISLADDDYPHFLSHQAAAGKAAAGAVFAGVVAASMGGGGSIPSGSAGGGGGGGGSAAAPAGRGGGGGSSSGGGVTQHIYIGDPMNDDSAMMTRRRDQRIAQRGLGRSSGGRRG